LLFQFTKAYRFAVCKRCKTDGEGTLHLEICEIQSGEFENISSSAGPVPSSFIKASSNVVALSSEPGSAFLRHAAVTDWFYMDHTMARPFC